MKDSFKFDFAAGEFCLDDNGNVETVTGVESLKMWINKILHTQFNRYKIYNGTKYGSNIEDLVVGHSYELSFAESELKREIEKALLKNDDIHSLSVSISRDKGTLKITVTLETAFGTSEEVVTL